MAGVDARGLRCRVRADDTVFIGPIDDRETYKGDEFVQSLFEDTEKLMWETLKKDATAIVREIRDGKVQVLCKVLVENDVLVRRGKEFPMKEFCCSRGSSVERSS